MFQNLDKILNKCKLCVEGFVNNDDYYKHFSDFHSDVTKQPSLVFQTPSHPPLINQSKSSQNVAEPKLPLISRNSLSAQLKTKYSNSELEKKRVSITHNKLANQKGKTPITHQVAKRIDNQNHFKCNVPQCSSQFETHVNLQYHLKCHMARNSNYKCPECYEIFNIWKSLVVHLHKAHGIRKKERTMEINADDCSNIKKSGEKDEHIKVTSKLDKVKSLHMQVVDSEQNPKSQNKSCTKKTRKEKENSNKTEFKSKISIKKRLKTPANSEKLGSSHDQMSQAESNCNNLETKTIQRRSGRSASKLNYNEDVELFEKPKKSKKLFKPNKAFVPKLKPPKQEKLCIKTEEIRKPICSICGYAGHNEGSLKYHMRLHMGETPFKCDHCDYSTAWKGSLIRHKRIHSGVQPFECLHCSRNYYDNHTFRLHLMTKHKDLPSAETMKQVQEQFFIDINKARNKKSYSDNQSNNEAESNSKESCKPHIYSFSGHGLDLDCILKIYTEPVKNQKLFNCNQCNYATYQMSFLKLHCIIHSNEKIYRCPYCVFTYITNQSKIYTYHVFTFHPGQSLSFGCALCPFLSSNEIDFVIHDCGIRTYQQVEESEEYRQPVNPFKLVELDDPDLQIKTEPLYAIDLSQQVEMSGSGECQMSAHPIIINRTDDPDLHLKTEPLGIYLLNL